MDLDQDYQEPGENQVEKPSKEEIKVAKWMKSNVAVKKTKFLNHNVEYFSSGKALDILMESKFAKGDNCLLPHRQAAIDFLDSMLAHKLFHRARKVPVSEQELKGKRKEKKEDEKEETKKKETDAESSHAENKQEKSTEKQEKRKRKIRLDMHPEQIFVDGHEAYVWIYDPIPMHYWILGVLVVIGAIAVCLFPLWPPTLRIGVYYLSVAAAGFLVFILGLAVVRAILFAFIWMVTGGKHHFWIFPNLTEDVGFFASFKPIYQHDYRPNGKVEKKDKKKKRKKDKDSDAEEEPLIEQNEAVEEVQEDRQSENEQSENESEASQKSSTGKDFEIIDPQEAEQDSS